MLNNQARQNITKLEFIGEDQIATGFQFNGTEVGGLSGITYNPDKKLYYALSDDRSQNDPARFYSLNIDLKDNELNQGDVSLKKKITILDKNGQPFAENTIDAEGIAFRGNRNRLYISSEGLVRPQDGETGIQNPTLTKYALTGKQLTELSIPKKFLPKIEDSNGNGVIDEEDTQLAGVRNNLAFESLTISPSAKYLYIATENALVQDGPIASLKDESPSRIIQYDLTTEQPIGEFLYYTDTIPEAPKPKDSFADNGLVEIIALDDSGTLLALERSFSEGVGNNIRLYEVLLQGTTDLSEIDAIDGADVDAVAQKRLIQDFGELGITLDNFEGMTIGPTLADGRQSLIVVSDNNFNEEQTTKFLAFALETKTTPSVTAKVETPSEIRYGDPNKPDEQYIPDLDDPAIYLHPTDPSQSIVIATLKDEGLAVYDLEGKELQKISPDEIRYNNVDLVYDFRLGQKKVDLAIASDRENDTLAIFKINKTTRKLTDITTPNILASIFGEDDGSLTAYGLASYTNPNTGKSYVFVSQRNNNKIAQLELVDNGSGKVNATVVRTITVPVDESLESEDAQIEGMVVDRELGYLYAAQEKFGIWKFSAEVDGGNTGTIVDTVNDFKTGDRRLEADAEGLTIYYGADGKGYLLASSQGDSTFTIYDRRGSNSYLGSFAIGDSSTIDSVEESDGSDIINTPLGAKFPQGMLVVHDGSNEPAAVFPDPDEGEIQNFNTNFKYVGLEELSELIELDPNSYDPRHPKPNIKDNFTLQLLHASDQEAGIPAINDAVNFSAVIEKLAPDYENTLRLASGDLFIPGPFFQASEEIYGQVGIANTIINNALGFQVSAFGNHDFDAGTETLSNIIKANPDIKGPGIGAEGYQGTLFPYLSSNLDFSTDEFLKDLVVPDTQSPESNSIAASNIVEVGGEKIGVVGATTPTLPELSSIGGVTVNPEDETDIEGLAQIIQNSVDELTATGIDKVILLSHMQQISVEEELAGLLKDVDIIMAGGSNTILANPDDPLRDGDTSEGSYPIELTSASNDPVVVVNTDGNYRYVGRLVVEFDGKGLISTIDEASGAYATDDAGVDAVYGEDVDPKDVANSDIVAVTDAIADVVLEKDGNIFGKTEVFLNGDRGDVRTQQTNLGDLTADANLMVAKQYDPSVVVSIKNGGGIRDNIGQAIVPAGSTTGEIEKTPPAANPLVGKEEGDISQLDIENSLRFNNELSLVTVTAASLEQIFEHAVSASEPGETPGQFPQIGGVKFSFDATQVSGARIVSLGLFDEEGNLIDTIVKDGQLVGDANREIRLVTLSFLADGGDGYPFPELIKDRVDLVGTDLPPTALNEATFTDNGTEQDALAEYLAAEFPSDDDSETPVFTQEDVSPELDERIQNLEFREDTVLSGDAGSSTEVYGTTGDDILEIGITPGFTGESNLVFAGAGNDLIDINQSEGSNRIYGGTGKDQFILGSHDRLLGGKGDDQFFVGTGGDNLITGGAGNDQFWIATAQFPESVNTITDFKVGIDVIGIAGLGLSFSKLTLTADGNNTIIASSEFNLAILSGVQSSSLTEASFVFI